MAIISGIVCYAAVGSTVRWGSVDTGYYMVSLLPDMMTFISRTRPKLYDEQGKRMTLDELPPGSLVRIKYAQKERLRWIEAVQVLELAEDDQPFG